MLALGALRVHAVEVAMRYIGRPGAVASPGY